MSKLEFTDQLRQCLNGRLDAEQIADYLTYYNEYIDTQLATGKTEAEIMQELGSPRLIARTILDANKQTWDEDDQPERTRRESAENHREQKKLPWILRFFNMPKWLRCVIGFGSLFLVMSLFFLVLKFLAPLILIFMIAAFMTKLFGQWLK